ncbi:hypothetical protein AVEN_58313-1 [Araneus ventricosus]|uniref:Uncharacterized protein n=1 Tax=Araneus ventricosus TaxID=182803 RepID=A0A4Y2CPZ1_ARAVE|nr:hypothetical protein AVEN_58313-1 [Araneus ventricosus]
MTFSRRQRSNVAKGVSSLLKGSGLVCLFYVCRSCVYYKRLLCLETTGMLAIRSQSTIDDISESLISPQLFNMSINMGTVRRGLGLDPEPELVCGDL